MNDCDIVIISKILISNDKKYQIAVALRFGDKTTSTPPFPDKYDTMEEAERFQELGLEILERKIKNEFPGLIYSKAREYLN